MKVLLSWLDDCFITKPDWDIVWEKLTMAGIEIESISTLAPEFSGVVVAEVISCEKVKNSDKLNLCKVDLGNNNIVNIICGANNVRAGIKVACAKVGAILPNDFIITAREMKGIFSNGMICSAQELGLKDQSDGIMILSEDSKVGTDFRQLLNLDDKIIDLKVTPNRGDCLSINGIAREINVLTGYEIKDFIDANKLPTKCSTTNIKISDKSLCPNYSALIINDLNNIDLLPHAITTRLTSCGYKQLSPSVDLANYVMHQTGQPIHIFDLDKINGHLVIKTSQSENVFMLGTEKVLLNEGTTIITDVSGKIIAIAGIITPSQCNVDENTKNILLLSGYFPSDNIIGVTKNLGINSESAYRFERGVDHKLTLPSIKLLGALIVEYCGGSIREIINEDHFNNSIVTINLSYQFINKLIGFDISKKLVNEILINLGFILNIIDDNLSVTVPSYRSDIKLKQDVVEEVIRVYGYDNIKPILPLSYVNMNRESNSFQRQNELKNKLVNLGFIEVLNYSFVEEKIEQVHSYQQIETVKLKNSIANLSVMRTSLFGSLIKNLINNLNRGHKQIKIFELARVFYEEESKGQPLKIAALVYGDFLYPSIESQTRDYDFYDLKFIVESLLTGLHDINYQITKDISFFHFGRCAKILYKNINIGVIGQLSPRVSEEFGLAKSPYLFELDVEQICTQQSIAKYISLSKFQKVERDISLVIDNKLDVGKVLSAVNKNDIKNLKELFIFDVYKLDSKSKGVALRCILQGDKTLSDEEVQVSVTKITNDIINKFPSSRLRE